MDEKLTFHCDMKDICGSCVLWVPPYRCCYQELLLTHRECNIAKCFFSPVCPHSNPASFKNKEQHLLKTLNEGEPVLFLKRATTLPSAFIPEILPKKKEGQEALSIVKDVDVPVIAVSLQNFFRGSTRDAHA